MYQHAQEPPNLTKHYMFYVLCQARRRELWCWWLIYFGALTIVCSTKSDEPHIS